MKCGHYNLKKNKNIYKCESCGGVSDKPKDCCGKPMKSQR